MTRAVFSRWLAAHPQLVCVRHPNPAGLGPRRYGGTCGNEHTLLRPNKDYQNEWDSKELPSYLPHSDDITLTEDGFTIAGGRIVYTATA